MTDPIEEQDDDIPAEIDFSGGQRGRFYRKGAELRLPVYLDAEVQRYLSARAGAKGIAVERLVNDLLKKDIELIEATK
jgi:hypothetical protein